METKEKYNSLEEFMLNNSEMEKISGGAFFGKSENQLYGSCWCASDRGIIATQWIFYYSGCQDLETGSPVGYGDC